MLILRIGLILAGLAAPAAAQPIQPTVEPSGSGAASGNPFIGGVEPPDSVRALLPWSGGAGGLSGIQCWFDPDDRLSMHSSLGQHAAPCTIPVNEDVSFAAGGGIGRPTGPIDEGSVRIVRSDGSPLEQVPSEGGTPIWWIPIGAPLGQYAVTARQGARHLRGDLAVVLRDPTEYRPMPRMRAWPRYGPPGTQFRATLAGFEPNQTVTIHVYLGQNGANATYLSTLATVRVDERGEATYPIPTGTTDPEGQYLLVSDPPSRAADPVGPLFVISRTSDWGSVPRGHPRAWENDRSALERLARFVVIEANKTWASVVAKDGRPIDSLMCVYDGGVLKDATAREKGRRTRGEYRVAIMTRPVELRDVRIVWGEMVGGSRVVDAIEVTVTESWDDRTFDLSGGLIGEDSGRFDFRYTLRNSSEQHWTEASRTTGCHHTGWWIVSAVPLGPSS